VSEWGCNFEKLGFNDRVLVGERVSGVVIFLESLLKKSSDWDLSCLISFLFFYMISRPPKTMREIERF